MPTNARPSDYHPRHHYTPRARTLLLREVLERVGHFVVQRLSPNLPGVRGVISLARLGLFGNDHSETLHRLWLDIAEDGDEPVHSSMKLKELQNAAVRARLPKIGTKQVLLDRLTSTIPAGVPPGLWWRVHQQVVEERLDAIIEAASAPSVEFALEDTPVSQETHVSVTSFKKAPYRVTSETIIDRLPLRHMTMVFKGRAVDTWWVRITVATDIASALHGSTMSQSDKEALAQLRQHALEVETRQIEEYQEAVATRVRSLRANGLDFLPENADEFPQEMKLARAFALSGVGGVRAVVSQVKEYLWWHQHENKPYNETPRGLKIRFKTALQHPDAPFAKKLLDKTTPEQIMSIFGDTPVGFVSFILRSPPNMNTTKIEEGYHRHIYKHIYKPKPVPQHGHHPMGPWNDMVEPFQNTTHIFQCKFCKYYAGETKMKAHLAANQCDDQDVGKEDTSSSISFAALKEFTLKMKAEERFTTAEEIFSAFEKN